MEAGILETWDMFADTQLGDTGTGLQTAVNLSTAKPEMEGHSHVAAVEPLHCVKANCRSQEMNVSQSLSAPTSDKWKGTWEADSHVRLPVYGYRMPVRTKIGAEELWDHYNGQVRTTTVHKVAHSC